MKRRKRGVSREEREVREREGRRKGEAVGKVDR